MGTAPSDFSGGGLQRSVVYDHPRRRRSGGRRSWRRGGGSAGGEGERWVSIALVELDILEKMANFAGA